MNPKVKTVLDQILEQFQNGNIPAPVALSMFPIPNIPSQQWSILNRTLMFLSGTSDARGYKQWKQANRFVKKGSKAIHILVPLISKTKDKETEEETQYIRGFMAKPVFRLEDTEGKELDYSEIKLPELPLLEKAAEWNISVKAIPGNYRYYGYYSPDRREIALATPEEKTFFHELAHAAHEKVKGSLQTWQEPLQEIVAELSAQVLCRVAGKRSNSDTTGNSYRYIQHYSEKLRLNPYKACIRVLSDVEQVLSLILDLTPHP